MRSYNDAQERQDLISNKVDVALYFTESLQDKSNISNINNPEDDPSYQASLRILRWVYHLVGTILGRH